MAEVLEKECGALKALDRIYGFDWEYGNLGLSQCRFMNGVAYLLLVREVGGTRELHSRSLCRAKRK